MRLARRGAAVLALAGVLCAGAMAPSSTEAAWTDQEVGRGSLAAGTVMPVTNFRCTASGLLQPVTFSWDAPALGGLTRSGYRWTLSGGLSGTGVLAAGATSVTIGGGLLTVGTGTLSLVGLGPGGWQSTPATGTVTVTSVLGIGLLSSCSP